MAVRVPEADPSLVADRVAPAEPAFPAALALAALLFAVLLANGRPSLAGPPPIPAVVRAWLPADETGAALVAKAAASLFTSVGAGALFIAVGLVLPALGRRARRALRAHRVLRARGAGAPHFSRQGASRLRAHRPRRGGGRGVGFPSWSKAEGCGSSTGRAGSSCAWWSARGRALELRMAGRGRGALQVGESGFWNPTPRWRRYPASGSFLVRHPYRYPESGGADLRVTLAPGSGEVELEWVALVPPSEPVNPMRLP